jgi:putative transposase
MSRVVVKRAYKYRFCPAPAGLLNRTFGSVRYLYNRALAERFRAWTQEQRRVTFAETCRALAHLNPGRVPHRDTPGGGDSGGDRR